MNGQYHLTERLEPEQYLSLSGEANIVTNRSLSSENKYLHFRCNKPPFDDVRVRLAAVHAIDREQVLAVVDVAGQASDCHISPVKFGYKDIENYPKYDPALSQQLLAEAGYPNGQGLPEIEYITSVGFYPKTREYGELITAMLQEQGFPVKLTTLEPALRKSASYRRGDGQGPGQYHRLGWAGFSRFTGSRLAMRPNYTIRTFALVTGSRTRRLMRPRQEPHAGIDRGKAEDTGQEEVLPLLAANVACNLLVLIRFSCGAMSKDLGGVLFLNPNGPIDSQQAHRFV